LIDSGHDEAAMAATSVRGQHVVAVAALIIRPAFADEAPDPRVLALRRAPDNLAGPGLWETVSGRVEQGEAPLAAVEREVIEESALRVDVEPRPFATYAAQRRGLPMIVILYRARYRAGEVVISAEHDRFAWLTAAEFAAHSSLQPLVTVVEHALALGTEF
jgi:8-oxo-dGTP diphosphatase